MDTSATRSRQQRQQKEKVINTTTEEKIEFQSFLISFIFHTFVLLTLSLIFCPSVEINTPILIKLSFGETEEVSSVSMEETQLDLIEEISLASDNKQDTEALPETVVTTEINDSIAIESPVVINNQEYVETIENTIPIETLNAEIVKDISPTPPRNTPRPTSGNQTIRDLVAATSTGLMSANDRGTGLNNTGGNGNKEAGQNVGGGGTGNGMEERLSIFGAKTGDVQVSISWDSIDDIDVHVLIKGNGMAEVINWTNRRGRSNGMLDIDMNANPPVISPRPIENVFWPYNMSPNGMFIVYVHFFRPWTNNTIVPVSVRVKNGDKIENFNISAVYGKNPQEVTRFNR
jgi:hypothetical protein